MIEPYMVISWIGILSALMIFFTIMDMVTVSKEEITFVTKDTFEKPSYNRSIIDDYSDVNVYYDDNDNDFIEGD